MTRPTIATLRKFLPAGDVQQLVGMLTTAHLTQDNDKLRVIQDIIRLQPYYQVMAKLYLGFEQRLDWFVENHKRYSDPVRLIKHDGSAEFEIKLEEETYLLGFESPSKPVLYSWSAKGSTERIYVYRKKWFIRTYEQIQYRGKPIAALVRWEDGECKIYVTKVIQERHKQECLDGATKSLDFAKSFATLRTRWKLTQFPVPDVSFSPAKYQLLHGVAKALTQN